MSITYHVHVLAHAHEQASVGLSSRPQDPQPPATTPPQQLDSSSTTSDVVHPLRAGKHQSS